uniref:Uncharacterized protein n=1 Tax=Psilocybe cubensis TaxID=181762 RepID=A0A8H7XWG6_PSICU
MPKHILKENYHKNAYELFPNGTIHPDIEHHDHPSHVTHHLLPVIFTLEKGDPAVLKAHGPGVYYFTEGECQYEDLAHPGKINVVSAGAVVHIDEGSALRWSSPSVAKGFGAFYLPVSIKSFDCFVVSA